MRYLAPLSALATLAAIVPAAAQGGPTPTATACPGELASFATCYSARHASGAYLAAAMPKTWNGTLVVYAHGGPFVEPPKPTSSDADLVKFTYLVKLGYGWVA